MRISIAATNPCHVWDLAVALEQNDCVSRFYSGYPRHKLRHSERMPVSCHSFRTLVTYALHGHVPERYRPSNRALFRWQDDGFDRWVARVLQPADFHHGIPGQCRDTLRKARHLGITTVLNHATGPASEVAKLLEPEYHRLNLKVASDGGYGPDYHARVGDEIELADYHCCASSLVSGQLERAGISKDRIFTVPYGADPGIWHSGSDRPRSRDPGAPLKILFAGQVSLRKGLRFLLQALEQCSRADWTLDCRGPLLQETCRDREAYQGSAKVNYHGACSQLQLAQAMRQSDLLVLPSLEEGFGLVVVQALACGLPCVVSDHVGAKDLIQHRINGSVFPSGDAEALAAELQWWEANPRRATGAYTWKEAASLFLNAHHSILNPPPSAPRRDSP